MFFGSWLTQICDELPVLRNDFNARVIGSLHFVEPKIAQQPVGNIRKMLIMKRSASTSDDLQLMRAITTDRHHALSLQLEIC